jgi:glycosyltransferase involved in cell wall biosynthesis
MGPAPSNDQRAEAAATGLALVDRPYRLEWMADPWDDVERAGVWLLSLAADVRPDVVHLNGFVHAPLPWRAPVLIAAHSCVRTWWRAVHHAPADDEWRRYTAAVNAGLATAACVVAPTRAMLDGLAEEYPVRVDGVVIPNGLAFAHDDGAPTSSAGFPQAYGCPTGVAAAASGTATKEPFVFAAGRAWDAGKNIAALCRVAPHVSWPIHVAGDQRGPDGTAASGVTLPGVCCLGPLGPAALHGWLDRAAIYALPARYEPFGLSVLEAAAHGCALVLGDLPSLRENWDGCARFVHPDDDGGLRGAIQELIDEPAARHALGSRARRRARRFTARRMAARYVRLYESLLT